MRSRWSTPRACRCAIPAATPEAAVSVKPGGRGSPWERSVDRVRVRVRVRVRG